MAVFYLENSLVEFRDQLLVDPEDHEATIFGPIGVVALIPLTSDNDNSRISSS